MMRLLLMVVIMMIMMTLWRRRKPESKPIQTVCMSKICPPLPWYCLNRSGWSMAKT